MPSVTASGMAGYYGVGPGSHSIDVGISLPAGQGITSVGIRSRVGTSGFGHGVDSFIYALPSGVLLVQGGPQNAGPNQFGGVQDPGLSGVWNTYNAGSVRTDITGFRFVVSTPDGSGWQGFGEVVQADYVLSAVPDTTAPSAPTNVAAEVVGPNSVAVTWGASTDDRGVAGYNVIRNGVIIATTANLAYTDDTAQPGQSYTYAVSAYDAAGNTSAAVAAAPVTTLDVTIDAIHTEDAAPDAAPYRVSKLPGHNVATVDFTTLAPSVVRAWSMRLGGTSRISGQRVAGQGAICGLAVCGRDGPLALAPGAMTTDITADELGASADGSRDITAYVWGE